MARGDDASTNGVSENTLCAQRNRPCTSHRPLLLKLHAAFRTQTKQQGATLPKLLPGTNPLVAAARVGLAVTEGGVEGLVNLWNNALELLPGPLRRLVVREPYTDADLRGKVRANCWLRVCFGGECASGWAADGGGSCAMPAAADHIRAS